jgi:hypothetical protein
MRPLILSLALLAGCYAPMGAHESLHPGLLVVDGIVNFANAQDVRPVLRPTNGCLPIDYYVGGANFLIRKTSGGCEWIAYDSAGGELASGTVPLASK